MTAIARAPRQLQCVTEFFIPLHRLYDQIRQFARHIDVLWVDDVRHPPTDQLHRVGIGLQLLAELWVRHRAANERERIKLIGAETSI